MINCHVICDVSLEEERGGEGERERVINENQMSKSLRMEEAR